MSEKMKTPPKYDVHKNVVQKIAMASFKLRSCLQLWLAIDKYVMI